MIIDKLNKERLGVKPIEEEKKVPEPEKEDSPLSLKEEIPVIVEEPESPKPEPIKEVSEVDDSKDWFNADDIKQKVEEPELMWFVPVDTYTGGFSAELVSKTLEAKEKKQHKEKPNSYMHAKLNWISA